MRGNPDILPAAIGLENNEPCGFRGRLDVVAVRKTWAGR